MKGIYIGRKKVVFITICRFFIMHIENPRMATTTTKKKTANNKASKLKDRHIIEFYIYILKLSYITEKWHNL